MADLTPRKGSPDPTLDEQEFKRRFLQQYADPAFGSLRGELDRIAEVAWDGYKNARKAPVTRKAGADFEDPAYDLSVDWYATREAIKAAQERHDDATGPARILLIS